MTLTEALAASLPQCAPKSFDRRVSNAHTIKKATEVEALRANGQPELAACCVPECVYRGFCPEFKCCGFAKSPAFAAAVAAYRGGARPND